MTSSLSILDIGLLQRLALRVTITEIKVPVSSWRNSANSSIKNHKNLLQLCFIHLCTVLTFKILHNAFILLKMETKRMYFHPLISSRCFVLFFFVSQLVLYFFLSFFSFQSLHLYLFFETKSTLKRKRH